LFFNLLLLKYFHSHKSFRAFLFHKENLAKRPSPKQLMSNKTIWPNHNFLKIVYFIYLFQWFFCHFPYFLGTWVACTVWNITIFVWFFTRLYFCCWLLQLFLNWVFVFLTWWIRCFDWFSFWFQQIRIIWRILFVYSTLILLIR